MPSTVQLRALCIFTIWMGMIIHSGLMIAVNASNITMGTVLNLSNDPASSGFPRISVSGSQVYVSWLNNSFGNSNVLFRTSGSNGSSFGPIVKVNNVTTGNSDTPEITAVGSNVYLVWQQNVSVIRNDIFFRASSDNGTSFRPPVDISSSVSCGGGCTVTSSSVPEAAAVGNNVYVVWLAVTTKGTDILLRTSNNGGSSFATAIILSSKAYGSAKPKIAATSNNVYVTWSDLGTVGRAQTFFAVSSNSGTSFGPAFSLSSTPAGETDLFQEIAITGNNVYVTWTNDTFALDNTMLAASTNNGASFGVALNLNKAAVTDLYPEIAASGSNVYLVWSDSPGNGNTAVLYRASSNNGATFGGILNMSSVQGTSNQQMIAVSGNNVYVTWVQTGTPSDGIYFVSSSDGGSTFGPPHNISNNSVSSSPAVGGSGIYAYVTWEDDTTGNGDIYLVAGSPAVFDYSIANSGTITVTQGGSGSNQVTLNLLGGSSQSVTLACSGGLPAGASCSFSPASGFPAFSSTLTIGTLSSTPTGSFTITVNGTGGGLTRSTQFTLTVASPQFDFTLSSPSPNSLTITQGSTSPSSSIAATLTSGTTAPVTFSTSSLPGGVTAVFTNNPCSPTCTTTVSFSATSTATLGTATVTIIASGGGVTQTQTLVLTVSAPLNFSMTNSGSIGLVQGGSGSNMITVTLVSGASQPVSLSASGLPTGASVSFSGGCAGSPTCSASPSFSSTLTITSLPSTLTGSFTITITASGGGTTRTTSFNLTITSVGFGGSGRVVIM